VIPLVGSLNFFARLENPFHLFTSQRNGFLLMMTAMSALLEVRGAYRGAANSARLGVRTSQRYISLQDRRWGRKLRLGLVGESGSGKDHAVAGR